MERQCRTHCKCVESMNTECRCVRFDYVDLEIPENTYCLLCELDKNNVEPLDVDRFLDIAIKHGKEGIPEFDFTIFGRVKTFSFYYDWQEIYDKGYRLGQLEKRFELVTKAAK